MTTVDMHRPTNVGKVVLAFVALLAAMGVATGIYRLAVGLGPTTNLKLKSVPGLKISQCRSHVILGTKNNCLLCQLNHLQVK